MDTNKKALINGLFLVLTLIINTLGAIGLINGYTQKEISDMYITLITPSATTFSIWGVIYSLLIISIIVMIVKKDDQYYKNAVEEISTLFIISSILNIAWIISFSFILVELSTLFILGFVITLSMICIKLIKINDQRRYLLPLTFGLYTGWLFIASVVNMAAALVKIEWNMFNLNEATWAIIMLVVAIILVFYVLKFIKNASLPLPIAWAYFGIYQFLKAPEGFNNQYPLVGYFALVGAIILVILALITFYHNNLSLIKYNKN